MTEQVTITSAFVNLPADIYYCDSMSANCVFVSAVTEFPYSFLVPPPYSDVSFVVKIVDSESCIVGNIIYTTTSPPTPSMTKTPTVTPGLTPTATPSMTQTNTPTLSETPSQCKQYYVSKKSTFISIGIITFTNCYGVLQTEIVGNATSGYPFSITICAIAGTLSYLSTQISVTDQGVCIPVTQTQTPTLTMTPTSSTP